MSLRMACAGPRLSEKAQLELECVLGVWLPASGFPHPLWLPAPPAHPTQPCHSEEMSPALGEVRASAAPLGIGPKEQRDGVGEWMIIAFGEEMVVVQADLSAHVLSSRL